MFSIIEHGARPLALRGAIESTGQRKRGPRLGAWVPQTVQRLQGRYELAQQHEGSHAKVGQRKNGAFFWGWRVGGV